METAREIRPNDIAPIGLTHPKQQAITRNAGVVHENVDGGKLFQQLLRRLGDGCAIGDINGQSLRLATRGDDRGGGRTARFG